MRLFRWLGSALTGLRNLLINITFFASLGIFIFVLSSKPGKVEVQPDSALLLDLNGTLVEQLQGDPVQAAVANLMGEPKKLVVIRKVVKVIEHATEDDRIHAIVLDLAAMNPAPIARMQPIRQALLAFKAAGKPIYMQADSLRQSHYYLASVATELVLHPMGTVDLPGFGVYRNYFKQGLDDLGVNVHTFQAGTYKSAIEPFIRNDMSESAKRVNREWLGQWWDAYRNAVIDAAELEALQFDYYVNEYEQALAVAKGDTALAALDAGLVSGLKNRVQAQAWLAQELPAVFDEEGNAKADEYRKIDYFDYLLATSNTPSLEPEQKSLGVLVLQGTITDSASEQDEQVIDAAAVVAQLEKLRQRDDLKALVVRVDSPGGSAYGSELIREQLAALRAKGVRIVVSMGALAASGGYWIATASDQIWAQPTTLTGSIGVFGMLPTLEKTLGKVGVNTDGVGTSPYTDAFRVDKGLTPKGRRMLDLMVDHTYHRFIDLVADARAMGAEQAEAVAQGRVWTGRQALSEGLVDKLGGIDDAIRAAAELAELGPDYEVEYLRPQMSLAERLLLGLSVEWQGALAGVQPLKHWQSGLAAWAERASGPLPALVGQMRDPNHIYAHCLCALEP